MALRSSAQPGRVGKEYHPKELKLIDESRVELMRDLNESMAELERESGKVTLADRLKKLVAPIVSTAD
ncbi:hypothetical protein [Polaromonas jejuensis]|uniref:Uncharacterized protein n=1 Tax=Polaromonas jejuensis TaxID=457502 RepID=A0ABW0QG24_9BURK|nr:hypothetical protein [Polaromonas jejuensis]